MIANFNLLDKDGLMKFKFTSLALSSIAVLMSATAIAGEPGIPQPQMMMNNGFFFGLQGGAGIGIAKHQGTYEIISSTSTQAEDTASSLQGLFGAKLGYQWLIKNHYALGLVFGFNYFLGKNEQEWLFDDQTATPGSGVNINNQLSPREQLNILVNEALALTSTFNLTLEGGFSTMNAKYRTSISAPDGANVAGPSSQTKFLYGGVVGAGFEYVFSRHMTANINMDIYMYAPSKFKTIATVGSTDQLSNRKLTLVIPTISIGYTYHF